VHSSRPTYAERIGRWFDSLPLRIKLIILIGSLFIVLTMVSTLIILQQGNRIINERLAETCTISLQHVSQTIKNDLLLYYGAGNDPNTASLHLGHIREAIMSVSNQRIAGLVYAGVIDRSGAIIAHTRPEMLNRRISPADSALFSTLSQTLVRPRGGTLEYVHPLYTRRDDQGERMVFLGDTVLGFSGAVIRQPLRQTRTLIITTTILMAVIAILFLSYIARRMTLQIDSLSRGVQKLADGDLHTEISIVAHDELGRLAREFNAMIVHLREKLQMQKFVSKLTVQMIRRQAGVETDQPPLGETRQVTVLFSDIRSFSAMTEKLGAAEVVKLLNIYLDLQARLIEKNNGIVDKFIGDQVMALFVDDRQVERAVQAAIDIQRSVRDLNEQRHRRGELGLQVGCGLHIGYVILGHMGSQTRSDYTVIGDVVNLAARRCSVAKPGQIIAPVELLPRLQGKFRTHRLLPVYVKGRRQPVEVLQVDYDTAVVRPLRN